MPMLEELSERAMRLRNDPEPRDHGSKGIGGSCLQSNARHSAKLCVADNTSLCEARHGETGREAVWAIMQRPGVRVRRVESLQRATEGW